MHPEYFKTRFRVFDTDVSWPPEFVVITAYATTGEQWTHEQNEQADAELYESLDRLGVWFAHVTGYAPDTGHAEPGYAAELSLNVARDLGGRLRQDAIFVVRGDDLSVTHCDHRHELVPVGSFRDRVDVIDPDAAYWQLSRAPESPWRFLTSQALAEALDRSLRFEPSHSMAAGKAFVPVGELSLHQAIIAAMPDDASRTAAQEEVDTLNDVDIKRLSHTFPEILDGGWVVQCEVTSSMVGGVWGLIQAAIGSRGYIFYQPDSEGREDWSPLLAGAWFPADDAQAFRTCVLSAYSRLWESEGFPPLLGEWVAGDPLILHACILSALDSERGRRFWSEVLTNIRKADLTDLPVAGWARIGAMSGVPSPWIERTGRLLADPRSGLTERAAAGEALDDEREALAALYLASVRQDCQDLRRPPPQWLGPVEQLLGTWDVSYADDSGMVGEGTDAIVVLQADGSFTWEPPPEWLAPAGEWGVELLDDGAPKLRFEGRGRRWSNYVVLATPIKDLGTFFHWQRSRWDGVVFKDRILRGYLASVHES